MTGLRAATFALVFAALAALAPCRVEAQLAKQPPVTDEEIATFTAAGTGSVTGRVIAVLPGDSQRYFTEWRVFLVPTIPYTHFFVYRTELAWDGNAIAAPVPDPRWLRVIRSTHTDAKGVFRFVGLPDGTYFAYTVIAVKDGRAETLYRQNYEQVGTTTFFGDFFGTFPNYGYVSRPYEHDYTCETEGVVGGTATVTAGGESPMILGLFGARNDGC